MTKQDIFMMVVHHSSEVIPELEGHEFKLNESWSDLGANSLDRAEILMMSMEALALRIPRVELFGAKTVGGLVDLLYEKAQSV
jgi:polyketide biosynthesis acyl carrier protein